MKSLAEHCKGIAWSIFLLNFDCCVHPFEMNILLKIFHMRCTYTIDSLLAYSYDLEVVQQEGCTQSSRHGQSSQGSDAGGGSMGSAWPSWPTMAHWCQHATHGTHAPHATHVLTTDRRKSWWLAATKWNSRRSTAGCSWYPRLPGVKNYVRTICTIADGCGTDSGARWNCWRLVSSHKRFWRLIFWLHNS